jgi:hypothetical protein
MKKKDFINKWIAWVSYTDREKLKKEMEKDLKTLMKNENHNHNNT